jgi:hypothetical protein
MAGGSMAEEEQDYDLDDGQRLSLLERTVSLNRKVVILLLVVAVCGLSVLSTVGIVSLFSDDVEYATKTEVELIRGENAVLKMQVAAYEESLGQYQDILGNSDAAAFKTLILNQEQSYQQHLTALKQGMRDLAKMLPGSRTWLEMYDEKMDLALAQSAARVQELAAIQTPEPPAPEVISEPKSLVKPLLKSKSQVQAPQEKKSN